MITGVNDRGSGTRASWASLALAVAASTGLLFVPTATTLTATPAGSSSAPVVTHESLLEHEGSGVLVVLALPVLLAALGAAPGRRRGRSLAAVLLWAFAAVGAASVGLLYAPAAVAMTVAAFRARSHLAVG